jgi:hypothetical protein
VRETWLIAVGAPGTVGWLDVFGHGEAGQALMIAAVYHVDANKCGRMLDKVL